VRGASPVAVRTVLDLGVFALGVALGGTFGLATVLYAAVFGLTMKAVGQALADHGEGRRARLGTEGRAVIVGPAGTPDLVTSALTGGGSLRPALRRRVLESV
jgi:hypothetical protein